MTASNEQTAVNVIIDKSHIKITTKRPQNGTIAHLSNTKIERISSSQMDGILSPNKVTRESYMSLLIPMINGGASLSLSKRRNKSCVVHSNATERKDEEYRIVNDIDSEEKDACTHTKHVHNLHRDPHRNYRRKYLKIKQKRKTHVFWKRIAPFSISDRFETVSDKKSTRRMRGYLYSLLIEPHLVNCRFAIVTPKRISGELELPHLKFRMHYPEYAQCRMDGRLCYAQMSSDIGVAALNRYEFSDHEWKWALEFNQILFEMLDPKLKHWWYCMQEETQSFELINYVIVPLLLPDAIKIDWKSLQSMVQYHYNKVNESYDIKHLLMDLQQNRLNEVVLCQNGKYFVPLDASQQREIARIKQLMDERKEEEKDLNAIRELLDDTYDDASDFYQGIIDKIGTKMPLLCARFDKLNDFITNFTSDTNKKKNAWRIEPQLDIMDIGRDGVCKAPFTAHFFHAALKLPFILLQFERIFGILHFIQSQQYRMRHMKHKNSFWMKIPLFTLSKIMFCEAIPISVAHRALFKAVGKEMVTLIYSTSSVLSILSSSTACNSDMVQITEGLMNDSVHKFRRQLRTNHIFDYLSPAAFRTSDWTPARFYNIKQQKQKREISGLIESYRASISCSNTGRNVNKYISALLYPTAESIKLSNQSLFCIQNDLFSSLWYYNTTHDDKLSLSELLANCDGIMQWMTIDQVLHLSNKRIKAICNDLDSATQIVNVSNEYCLFDVMSKYQCSSSRLLNNVINRDGLKQLNINSELQSILCAVVRDIGYEFVYPSVLMTMIDPFRVLHAKYSSYSAHNIHKRLSFELLYDLGSIVLNVIITLSVASAKIKCTRTWQWPLLLYAKCLTSTKYLSYKCKYHRFYKHIMINSNKEIDGELMAAFMVAIIGSIYLDSNLSTLNHANSSRVIELQNVDRFIQTHLTEIVNQRELKHILFLFRNESSSTLHDID